MKALAVAIVIVVAVVVVVAPLPIFILIGPAAAVEIFVMAMGVAFPFLVIDNFRVIPAMIIVIFGIVDADARGAPGEKQHAQKSGGNEKGAGLFLNFAHGIRLSIGAYGFFAA